MPEPLPATDVSAIIEGRAALSSLTSKSSQPDNTTPLPVSHPDIPPASAAAEAEEKIPDASKPETLPDTDEIDPKTGHKRVDNLPVIKIKL